MTASDRRIAEWIDACAVLAIAGLVLVALIGLAGCARFPAATLGAAPASSARCEQLDDRASLWGAVGGASGVLAGGAGLATVATDDRTLRTTLALGSVVAGALAAGAAYVTRSASERFVEGGCAR